MKIKVIMPITSDVFNEEIHREFRGYAGAGVEFDVENLDYGPASIESEYDEALAVPDILNKVKKAAEEGFDGVIIDCFGDPGVKAAREVVDIPVCGGFEPAILLAAGLGQHLGIVTVLPNVVSMLEDLAKKLGLASKLVSIRYVDIPVLELVDRSKLEDALYQQSLEAILKDGAHVLILGCTGMMGMAKNLHDRLKAEGYDVPVIDPAFAAMKMIESYIAMGVKHSRLTYMVPPDKPRKWWD
ncbi:MAG: aspartate/glutamate racemase family protein [Thermoanaerobacteraceae bacterium]|nr:aspartate/glutamate racemase family protein [Thermoanaerobacteraceae bacterium]